MQQPVVKSERHEPVYSTPSYYQQQQQQLLQQQQQQNVQLQQQQRQTTNGNSSASTRGKVEAKPASTTDNKNEESLPDFPSIKGNFGWTMIENVHIPFILRCDKPFVSVRVVEMKLLTKYPNSYPDELGKHAPLTSFYITPNEVKLLNEINVRHCDFEYGRKPFSSNDLIVQLPDFIKFYELVKKTFPEVSTGKGNTSGVTGWLQIKNTVTPYIRRGDQGKYVPLSVIQYAAGLLTNVKVSGVPPTLAECKLLNDACSKAGVEFTFSESTTRLINLNQVLKVVKVEVTELPSTNPLKHATYMELPTSTNVSQTHVKAPTSNGTLPSDKNINKLQTKTVETVRQYQDQLARQQAQNNKRLPISNQVFDPRLMSDPRFVELLRMQMMLQPDTNGMFGTQNGNSNTNNMSVPAASAISPLMQYYESLQKATNLSVETQRQLGQTIGHSGCDESRSPGCSQSPRSRPPSQTRPPSGPSLSRPPSASPLSPTAGPSQQPSPHSQHITSYPALFDAARMPFLNNPSSLQQPNMLFDNMINSNSNRLNENSVPHHQRPKTNMTSAQISSSTHSSKPPPPPLVLMGEISGLTSNTDRNNVNNSVLQSPNHVIAGPSAQDIVEQTRQQSAVSTDSSENVWIKGAWLNNKSISCLNVDDAKRKGQYCLVEAVCKLYFNGCSVQEFLFALENVLNIPLVVCNKQEEKAFIGYYSLPVIELKCNKMIRFEDLEKYFPQLTYMFPSKETLNQSDIRYDTSLESMNPPAHQKRLHSDRAMYADQRQAKIPRNSTGGADEDDSVIILD